MVCKNCFRQCTLPDRLELGYVILYSMTFFTKVLQLLSKLLILVQIATAVSFPFLWSMVSSDTAQVWKEDLLK